MAEPAQSGDQAEGGAELTARIFIAVSPAMLSDVEDYRFLNRYKSQSGAVRKLLELGLRTAAWEAQKKR
jgi:Arc/MetJ-type ribon-helix-helix transcriptional regulator